LKLVTEAGGDLFDSLGNFRAVLECCLAINMSGVVQIDINRKPCEVEVKEIECGSAFEYEFSFENGVPMKFDQEFPQPEHLLKIFSRKAVFWASSRIWVGVNFMFAGNLFGKARTSEAP